MRRKKQATRAAVLCVMRQKSELPSWSRGLDSCYRHVLVLGSLKLTAKHTRERPLPQTLLLISVSPKWPLTFSVTLIQSRAHLSLAKSFSKVNSSVWWTFPLVGLDLCYQYPTSEWQSSLGSKPTMMMSSTYEEPRKTSTVGQQFRNFSKQNNCKVRVGVIGRTFFKFISMI